MSEKHIRSSNVEIPYEIGEPVYYVGSTTYYTKIECKVDSYKFDNLGFRIRLVPIHTSFMQDIWIPVDGADKYITRITDSKQSLASDSKYNIQLYQAIAKYKFDDDFNFVIKELPIHHIEDDCTIITTTFYAVGPTVISDKFAGIRTLHTGKEIRLSDDMFCMYSTDKQKCLKFIQNHLDIAESKICAFHNIIDKFREQFKEA